MDSKIMSIPFNRENENKTPKNVSKTTQKTTQNKTTACSNSISSQYISSHIQPPPHTSPDHKSTTLSAQITIKIHCIPPKIFLVSRYLIRGCQVFRKICSLPFKLNVIFSNGMHEQSSFIKCVILGAFSSFQVIAMHFLAAVITRLRKLTKPGEGNFSLLRSPRSAMETNKFSYLKKDI